MLVKRRYIHIFEMQTWLSDYILEIKSFCFFWSVWSEILAIMGILIGKQLKIRLTAWPNIENTHK